jgi:hypothetical protein
VDAQEKIKSLEQRVEALTKVNVDYNSGNFMDICRETKNFASNWMQIDNY